MSSCSIYRDSYINRLRKRDKIQGFVEYSITFQNKLIEFNNTGAHMYMLYLTCHTEITFTLRFLV